MNTMQQMPCPDTDENGNACTGVIHFDAMQLIRGTKYVCPVCQLSIGLPADSRPVVENAMNKLNELKQSVNK